MREEKENFARFLLRIRHELRLTMLWVEHDMQMVTELADRIVVLNHGEVIADGRPDAVRRNRKVVEAYLGADDSDTASEQDGGPPGERALAEAARTLEPRENRNHNP
jgi:ABC-type glutathione transport system ATPase component